MAGVISTGNHPKALWPGVHKWFGMSYNEYPLECLQIFAAEKSSRAYEEDVESTGFGLPVQKSEGGSVSYDSHSQGETKRYTHVAWGLGYIVTREEKNDNLYLEKSFKRSKALAFSMRQGREIVSANVLNRAVSGSYLGADGKSLLATDHPTESGDQQNEPTTAVDFSEAALEDMLILIADARNARDHRIALKPKQLIIPTALQFDAQRVLKSELQSGTANNDINAVRSMGLISGGYIVNHYLTDTDQWFIQTMVPDGMRTFNRIAVEFTKDNDFDTDNAKAKAYERYSVGWTDWRGMYGSPGI